MRYGLTADWVASFCWKLIFLLQTINEGEVVGVVLLFTLTLTIRQFSSVYIFFLFDEIVFAEMCLVSVRNIASSPICWKGVSFIGWKFSLVSGMLTSWKRTTFFVLRHLQSEVSVQLRWDGKNCGIIFLTWIFSTPIRLMYKLFFVNNAQHVFILYHLLSFWFLWVLLLDWMFD